MSSSRGMVILTLLMAGLVLLAACGDEETIVKEKESTIRVTVTASSSEIDTGEKITLTADAGYRGKDNHFEYAWTGNGGHFVEPNSPTTDWIAPADAQLYTLSCVVTDNDDVAIGKITIAVDTYLPTDEPYYEGAAYCAACHDGGIGGDQYSSWSQTAHAHALSTLQEIGQDQNEVCLACHTVGSQGLAADPALDNRGYDDMSVEAFANVQCENCHGPASGHPTGGSVAVSLGADLCGDCHNGPHHPTYEEWQTSGHGSATVTFAAGRASCAKCHNGVEGPRYLDNPAGYINPSEDPAEIVAHTCPTCHDPHGNDNPGYLRDAAVSDVLIPNNILITDAGLGRLCISCHNGRRQDYDVIEQIQTGSSHFGPHHSVQGDMLAGANAYEDVNPSFTFGTSKHLLVEDGCVHCHTHAHDEGEQHFTGHTFEPTVEACQSCHGALTSFEDVIAKQDFDGNGTIEGVQIEVRGLLDLLQQTLADAADPLYRDDFLDPDLFEDAIGDTNKTTLEMREAAYNWAYVAFDGSSGVHNTTYAVQLLQQSILHLDPGALPGKTFILDRPLD